MTTLKESYPLQWPVGYPRTSPMSNPNFGNHSLDKVTKEVLRQIKLLGGREVVISSNVPIRKDGLPYSDYQRRAVTDKGVAVYFVYNGKQLVIACDKWDKVEHNVYAVALTIEAMRGIGRWGATDILNRAFQGLTELPMIATAIDYWSILDMPKTKNKEAINARYKELAKVHYLDEAKMRDLNTARDEALKHADH